ncbi:hypothetical protein BJY04DRAFT_17437 [Aspergillus karnatakaensis]|uniref:uncharacterized protein n=1 Tax=Aspergillus karnatakaensis TaxID=1810916 RepID=UPI003CCDFA0A
MTNYQTDTPARVTGPVLIGVVWGGTALSFLFITARTLARIFTFRRLWWDDAFAITAWLLVLAQSVTLQTQLDSIYLHYQVTTGNIIATPEIQGRIETLFRAECAVLMFFYASLWSIKASFLIVFRRLAGASERWVVWFWCVVGFVVAGYVVCLGDNQYRCLVNDHAYIQEHCTQPDATLYLYTVLIVNMLLDVTTDMARSQP